MKAVRLYMGAVAAALLLAGCGGGGLGLTGGSVPVGGRAVVGVALLPDGSPAAGSAVAIRSVPAGALLGTSTTDSGGRFTVGNVAADTDLSVVVTQPPSNSLEVLVARPAPGSNTAGPLDVGTVNALTTVVAACLHLEHGPAPEDSHSILANQREHLNMQVRDNGYSVDRQRQWIADPNSLNAEALSLIVPAANTELAAFAANPNMDTASTALNGLLGYVRAAHRRGIRLSDSMRTALINAQLAGRTYAPGTVAAALNTAGVRNATASQVDSASQREHTELSALPSAANGVSPLEALVIAADVDVQGGFQLDQRPLETFLNELLKQ